MDKSTNGFVRIPKGQEKHVKADIKKNYETLCLKDYNVNAKVTVKLVPIEEIIVKPEERLDFTHGYSVRCRG